MGRFLIVCRRDCAQFIIVGRQYRILRNFPHPDYSSTNDSLKEQIMEHLIDKRLSQLGIDLPIAPLPAANYLPYVVSGNLLFIAGQAAVVDGRLAYTGRLGAELGLEQGQAAARICALFALPRTNLAQVDGGLRLVTTQPLADAGRAIPAGRVGALRYLFPLRGRSFSASSCHLAIR